MGLRIHRGGDTYYVNHLNQIHGGPNEVKPDNSWRLIGASEYRMVHGRFRPTVSFSVKNIRDGIVPWKWKNGKQRCFIRDNDHGTIRTWMSPGDYYTTNTVD